MGILFGAGVQMLLDGQQNYVRAGLQCFLRLQNFPPQGDWQEVGVPFTPSGAAAGETGFTDLEILPPPEVLDVSTHDIGLSGGRLQFGARTFYISDTFVENIREKYPEIIYASNVWRNWDAQLVGGNWVNATASVIGIIYDD